MKKIRYLIEYGLLRILDGFLQMLPERLAVAFGIGFGKLMSRVLSKRDVIIRDNLRQALPNISESQISAIAAGVWRNMGRVSVELCRGPLIFKRNLNEWAVCDDLPVLEKLKKDGKGVIFVASHFTNWELNGVLLGIYMKNFLAIARPLKNPYAENWLSDRRAAVGVKTILHREAVKKTLSWLKKKNSVGILVDQNLYTGGIFSDFMGRPAATTTLPALLHLRTGAPIVHTYLLREGNRYRMMVDPPLVFTPQEDDEKAVRLITEKINERIGEVIRQYPENWFWVHNRWKRKPEA